MRGSTLSAKLALVGLALVSEDEAMVPPADRGRYVPCRVLETDVPTPLPPDPVGYLLVGFDDRVAKDSQEILEAIQLWGPGETLKLRARRNTYPPGAPTGWWEGVVVLRMRDDG